MFRLPASSQRGQTLVLFAASLIVLLLMTGLVIDSGYAFAQRRSAQNAADFAAIAGSRIVGESFTGKPAAAGTGENVLKAIQSVLAANRGELVSAQYINAAGAPAGTVGTGSIPPSAAGVVVNAKTAWRPFFLGIMGVSSWSAGADATALTKGTAAGGVLPIGIQDHAFDAFPLCDLAQGCDPQKLTPGTLNGPGNFGWLAFGAGTKFCENYGLGQLVEGCEVNQGFLQNEITPPGNSHGCCTTVKNDPNPLIGGLTGNEWGDLSYYIENRVPIWVPIWDTSGDNGRNFYYHIVGFGAVLLTGQDVQHGKWITGVRLSGIGDTPNAFGLIGVTGEVYLVH
jgi:Putative Flp pilus-assembly TadE/G-like